MLNYQPKSDQQKLFQLVDSTGMRTNSGNFRDIMMRLAQWLSQCTFTPLWGIVRIPNCKRNPCLQEWSYLVYWSEFCRPRALIIRSWRSPELPYFLILNIALDTKTTEMLWNVVTLSKKALTCELRTEWIRSRLPPSNWAGATKVSLFVWYSCTTHTVSI